MTPSDNPADTYPIRGATTQDAAKIVAVILDAGSMFREAGMAAVSDIEPPAVQEMSTQIDTTRVWVAVTGDGSPNNGLVGAVMVHVVDGNAHIDQVSVSRSHQERGVGRRLVETVEEWARAQGHTRVTLTTFTDVAWNAPYYSRLGYHVLAADKLGDELTAVRREEARAGLDKWGRCAMAHDLTGDPPTR